MGQTQRIDKLRELARNLWWTWQPNVISLFRELDPVLWRKLDHNPVEFLKKLPAEQLTRRASEMALDSRIDYAFRRLAEYLKNNDSWGSVYASSLRSRPVAYFSAEFGLHESLPIYSGGLGVLAGDHLKSASDLGVPLVGIGLLYDEGYFRQTLDGNGWQQEHYLNANRELLPIERVLGADDQPLTIAVETNNGILQAHLWRVEVGRTTLYLLDSNMPENSESDRALTARLYGGDARVRIRQELLLGVGGVRALHALGIHPSVLHLNEGHSAFAGLELIRAEMEANAVPFGEAVRNVATMTVFTTHTPVAAGHDRFPAPLVEENLGKIREGLHLSYDDFMGLGRVYPSDLNEPFCMTVLALKMSRHANGVSALHGQVSRRMWQPLYPHRAEEEVPIGHITNGVHVQTWVAPQMHLLYDRHLGTDWPKQMRFPTTWEGIETVEDAELWETQQVLKARLIDFVRRRLVAQAQRRDEGDAAVQKASTALDLNALTIGFARRFATYKRAGLVLHDVQRLAEMIESTDRPIQFIFAGKAHPEDRFGKELIQNIVKLTRQDRFSQRIVFVEDYDMNVARQLVQGVDVWLNNPRRPQEASGTSGEKALLNGALNFSILDGWWAEAYDGSNGFAIGYGQNHSVPSVQDERDFQSLLETLTTQVIPLYYSRDSTGLPRGWIARQKNALRTLAWRFNADRMVMDYVQNCYLPAAGGLYLRDAAGLRRGPQNRGRPGLKAGRVRPPGIRDMIGEKLGTFRIESVLGTGAMGVVYRATSEATGKPSAVKVIGAEVIQRTDAAQRTKADMRFRREADILYKFRHPNIVRVLAIGKYQGTSYIAMEFIQGETIEQMLKRRGPLPWREVITLAIQLCEALHYAHEHGVVHRDLKPSNLMVNEKHELKLTDFGIAKLLDEDATALTATGRTLGTAAYMAPEQIRGTPEISHKTDLYALGVVLYQMLTGRAPFEGPSAIALMHCHLNEPAPRPSARTVEVPRALDDLVVKLMAKSPADRPWDAAAVAVMLADLRDKAESDQTIPMVWPSPGGSRGAVAADGENGTLGTGAVRKGRSGKRKRGVEVPTFDVELLKVGLMVGILVAMVGFVGYMFWPPSARYLYTQAEQLMASERRHDWSNALANYIEPLDRRFPDHPYKQQTQAWRDKIPLADALGRATTLDSPVRTSLSEPAKGNKGEHEYVLYSALAKEASQRGDDLTAIRHWEEMAGKLNPQDADERPWVLLAGKRGADLKKEVAQRHDVVSHQLVQAEQAARNGRAGEAATIRENIVNRYGRYSDVADLLVRAGLPLPSDIGPSSEHSLQPRTQTPIPATRPR